MKTEQELAEIVVNWLIAQHWDVYQEVQFGVCGSVADIVAVRAGYVWIIETKLALSITVLEQAHKWHSHFRSIAVPHSKNWKDRQFAYWLANKQLNLGVLEVGNFGVQEIRDAPLMRDFHNPAKRMMGKLTEEHRNYAKAGSKGGGHLTPYRHTMDMVKRFIQSHPGCTLKEVMADVGKGHYATNQSARGALRQALEHWETWCKVVKDGKEFRYFVE